jgi:NADPH2:quinone reductase
MTRCVIVKEPGASSALQLVEQPTPSPGPHEVLIRQTAIGVNYIDIYFRTGLYKGPQFPFVLGMEGAGVVEQIGSDVSHIHVGDRVAYAGSMGAYASERLLPADRAVRLPPHIDDETAAAVMLKGMTAEYLLHRLFAVQPQHTVLFHAAAGGVGSLACQWAKRLGAHVIGTVGSQQKVPLAIGNGCDAVVLTSDPDWPQQVRELTQGAGVDVAYDSVGQATFQGSLACLKPRGMAVPFGQSSGKVAPFDVTDLSAKGSLFLSRPTLADYTRTRADLEQSASTLFAALGAKDHPLNITIGQRFALKDVAQAHDALELRKTIGSTVLLP